MSRLVKCFLPFVREKALFEGGGKVIVGVSGGPDSMALLDLLNRFSKKLGITPVVAHVNYGLRGRASDQDERLVRKAASELGLVCEVFDRPKLGSGNLQEAARDARYAFFIRLAARYHAPFIATAHHKNDQAETILMHMIRGAGLKGLSGMSPTTPLGDVRLVRPLLCAEIADIMAHVKAEKVLFRVDATNTKCRYTRNSVRATLLPAIERFNPNAVGMLCSLGDRMRREDEALAVLAGAAFDKVVVGQKEHAIVLDRKVVNALPEGLRARVFAIAYTRIAGDTRDLNADQITRMVGISHTATAPSSYRLPASAKFLCDKDTVTIEA